MGAVAIGRGYGVNEQRFAGLVHLRGLGERRVKSEGAIEFENGRRVEGQGGTDARIIRVANGGESLQSIGGSALDDEDEPLVGLRGCGEGNARRKRKGACRGGEGQEIAAIEFVHLQLPVVIFFGIRARRAAGSSR